MFDETDVRRINGYEFEVGRPDDFDHDRAFVRYQDEDVLLVDLDGRSVLWGSEAGRQDFLNIVEDDTRFGVNPIVEGCINGVGIEQFYYSDFRLDKNSEDYDNLVVRLDRSGTEDTSEALEEMTLDDVESTQSEHEGPQYPEASWTEDFWVTGNQFSVTSPERDLDVYRNYLKDSLEYEEEMNNALIQFVEEELENMK